MVAPWKSKFLVLVALFRALGCQAFTQQIPIQTPCLTTSPKSLSSSCRLSPLFVAPTARPKGILDISKGGALIAGQEALTTGSKITGLAFAMGTLLKGVTQTFAPSKSLEFMGLKLSAPSGDNVPSAVEFLVTWGGAFAMSMGLTALLALRAEFALLGHVPSTKSMFHCIYLGILPMLGILTKLIGMKQWPETLYLNDKRRVTYGLLLGLTVSALTLADKMEPYMPTTALSGVFAVFGACTLKDPSTIFRRASEEQGGEVITPEESLVGRTFGLQTLSYAVLVHMLRNPIVNVLPAIGFSALTNALGNLYIAYGTDDCKRCDLKTDGLLASAAGGFAVAAISLRHFLLK